ncbi:MAG TPA: histidine kinase [Bryobacteraceae bacterium]|nr:histidine kinase [Bryobacteraceae bacterium]
MIDIFGDGRHLSVNILGHAAGVLIFGIFLALMLSQRSVQQLRTSRLSLLAGALALIWNAASLLVIVMGRVDPLAESIVAGVAFCALSVLPSVLLDLCLGKRFSLIVRSGYGLSSLAVLAHLVEWFGSRADFHRLGLTVITIGFGLLSVVSVLAVLWSGEENPRSLSMRLLSAMSLFLLAISFVHFDHSKSSDAWSTELAVHHAGIPLALFIIMQDYRFVFLDAFVRFLVNGLLAVIFALFIASYSPHLGFPMRVICLGTILFGFAATRGFLQRMLTKLVFRQPDTERALRELRALGAQAADETGYIDRAAEYIAECMNAKRSLAGRELLPQSVESSFPVLAGAMAATGPLQKDGVEVVVPIGHGLAERKYIFLGPRRGGRRYLSEDLEVLARMAACVGEQMEHIREAETRRLVSQAELRALQAQIHPHFLFNAFNTLYGIIPRHISDARRMLLNLAEVFRYFLQSENTFVPLEEELRIVKAYLGIEELRLGDKLKISIDVDNDALRAPVPVLSIQPLVENAIKHGVAARPEGGAVHIQAKREGDSLRVLVHDTGPGFAAKTAVPENHNGVGLDNVSRRLVLCYGPDARLRIESDAGGTTVSFVGPCERLVAPRSLIA